jgi:hypothetical protein
MIITLSVFISHSPICLPGVQDWLLVHGVDLRQSKSLNHQRKVKL